MVLTGLILVLAQGGRPPATQATQPVVRVFPTPEWSRDGRMEIKGPTNPSDTFLIAQLKRSPEGAWGRRGTVYRYDARKGELCAVPAHTWDESGWPQSVFGSSQRSPTGKLTIGNDYRLRYDGEPVRTRGQADVRMVAFPNSDCVAVISALQLRREGQLPMPGTIVSVAGTYFHQWFCEQSGRPLARAVDLRLPVRSGSVYGKLTLDRQYIVFRTDNFTHVSIVSIQVPNECLWKAPGQEADDAANP